jgi:predicted O-methyltransferase YrrM
MTMPEDSASRAGHPEAPGDTGSATLLARARAGELSLVGWGAGALCERILPAFDLEIRALIDADEQKWGRTVLGLPIASPELLDNADPARTVILALSEDVDGIRQRVRSRGEFPVISGLSALNQVSSGAAVRWGRSDLLAADYVSPGLDIVVPDDCFPNRIAGDRTAVDWEFLRADHPHAWYCDRRFPGIGLLNRDESHLLYNNAKLFAGGRGLEVGAWVGWSACHIALAGIELDVVDPFFTRAWLKESVECSLAAAGVRQSVRLHTGYSPGAVAALASDRAPWSFIFIDGDHEGAAPRLDAEECERYTADDALILFHDLASPHVAAGLDLLADRGWKTMVYDTAQITGVAWRGKVSPASHTPDPAISIPLPAHLARHPVSR